MKTVKLFFGIFVFTFLSLNNSAQVAKSAGIESHENTMFRTSNSIELRGSSDVRKIEVEVNEDGSNFDLDVMGEIQTGSMKIEIYDPRGKKRGSFSTGAILESKSAASIKTENDSKKSNYEERVNGRIMQQNAASGTWIIKIIPQNAYGRLNFRSQQSLTK